MRGGLEQNTVFLRPPLLWEHTKKMALPLFVCIITDKIIEQQGQEDTAHSIQR